MLAGALWDLRLFACVPALGRLLRDVPCLVPARIKDRCWEKERLRCGNTNVLLLGSKIQPKGFVATSRIHGHARCNAVPDPVAHSISADRLDVIYSHTRQEFSISGEARGCTDVLRKEGLGPVSILETSFC